MLASANCSMQLPQRGLPSLTGRAVYSRRRSVARMGTARTALACAGHSQGDRQVSGLGPVPRKPTRAQRLRVTLAPAVGLPSQECTKWNAPSKQTTSTMDVRGGPSNEVHRVASYELRPDRPESGRVTTLPSDCPVTTGLTASVGTCQRRAAVKHDSCHASAGDCVSMATAPLSTAAAVRAQVLCWGPASFQGESY
jgi:hypothetical protein